ncbi:MAG TPA: AAA family ATPase [Acidimicrobiales bacterium]|nr:AAA family ATPase [Acidimicrobiales bacterium]
MTPAEPAILRGRTNELARLDALVRTVRRGRSEVLVVSGEAGMGKSRLLDEAVEAIGGGLEVRRMVAAESEMELAYAGLQFLCGPLMAAADGLPAPQREALESAFGLRTDAAPNPLRVGLATLNLLTEVAGDAGLVCVIDDAQWLDTASAEALSFVCRRLDAEQLAVVLVMRTVGERWRDLPELAVKGLDDVEARALLRSALVGPIDPRVEDQIIDEAGGNPLALVELPRAIGPVEAAGGFGLHRSGSLEVRIEDSLVTQLESLPEPTRLLLLIAAADPTGDPGLLWRARSLLAIGDDQLSVAEGADALEVGTRVRFRHPLVRSAVYRMASQEDRRQVHAALADATYEDRDPDRRAWHRANATVMPDESVAAALERSAERARARGGAAAAAAFLERAASLTPDDASRIDRLLAAAEAKHDVGASDEALRMLDSARGHVFTDLQRAHAERLRARAGYAIRRDASSPGELLAAAKSLDALDPVLARDTYIEALAAALYGGRLGDSDALVTVAQEILEATDGDRPARARDLILRGQALLAARGQQAAAPTLRRALRAYLDDSLDGLELHWMWFASRAAQDLWDADALRVLAARQVEIARAAGVMTVLPIALSVQMVAQTLGGDLAAAETSCDEIDVLRSVMGHSVPSFGRMFLAAYQGQATETERLAGQIRADGTARGEGYAVSAANFAEAILYNGLGRYPEALEAARRELPFTHELNHAMRSLLELIEAAVRVDETALATEALEHLEGVTAHLDSDYGLGVLAMARAQLRGGAEAESLFEEALERFGRAAIPIMIGRTRLLYGEMLRRSQRRVDARAQLRGAHEVLLGCGLRGFAERAARELEATGETLRVRADADVPQLTAQETNVVRLAREGLTNRDIGARLFISDRTVEYHLHKVFIKLGISSRRELETALGDLELS